MSRSLRYQLCIVAAAGMIFFMNLGGAALFDMDEALYSSCAREMLQRGNLVVPWFNGAMFPEKPVLMFWTMIGGFELFGVGELGARFFSAIFGVGTALLAFHLGRFLFSQRVGLWAGLITASTLVFTISARAATVDSALTFFTTLAFLMFVVGWKKAEGGRRKAEISESRSVSEAFSPSPVQLQHSSTDPSPSALRLPPSAFPLPYAAAAYACIGVAVLGKGPVGMLLPLAAMGLFLLAIDGWRSLFRSAWWMRPFTMIVVIAAVAVPWYVAVGLETNWQWPKQFLLEFNLRPFQKPIQGHGAATELLVSIAYYFYQIPAVLVGFFPWSVFLGPTFIDAFRRLKEGRNANEPLAASQAARWRIGVILALCWFGTWFVFWSICKTKLLHYLLPAYPALALLTACFIDRWLSAEKGSELFSPPSEASEPAAAKKTVLTPFPPPFPPWALRNAWISTIAVGIGIVIAIPIVGNGIVIAIPILAKPILISVKGYMPGEGWLGLLGLLLVLGGAWCWWKTSQGRYRQAAVGFAATSAAFLTAVFGFAALRVDRFQNAKPMMAAICADEREKVSGTVSTISSPSLQPRSPIAAYCFFRESTVFYGGKPVTKCEDDEVAGRSAKETLAKFLAQADRRYVITTDEYEAELKKAFGDRLKVIHREPRFLADGEMVIFRHGD